MSTTPPLGAVPGFDPEYPARAVVDLTAIRDNVVALRRAATGAALMAVVKGDAYGHGLLPVARAALAGGATWLGAAQVGEALRLRQGGVTPADARVLTWLYAPGAPLEEVLLADIDLGVAAPWGLDAAADAARSAGRPARVHLKVDTGLGRNGITLDDLPAVLRRAAELRGLVEITGVMSHFACADEPGHPSIDAQAKAFEDTVTAVERAGFAPEVRHLANSAATLTRPDTAWDLVRTGIAMYGLTPVPQISVPSTYGLRPAMTVEARLATVKRVPAGSGVSYGLHYTTSQDTTLGVIPLGYADGIPRHASGGALGPGGPVLVGGGVDDVASREAGPGAARVVRVAGRVCMDQIMVDLGPYASEQAGDVVTLFGQSDGVEHAGAPNAEDWAQAAGTISYEIVTRVAARMPRVYVGAQDVGADAAGLGALAGKGTWS
ncbi:alanine racemase [Myceligenerans pegani]|uniref:Alanine racemase n=1 Tax=Myceligenerans pegani TaxID=2776917 RepID=A0ABR9MSF5_9MICO|nr:alanine racemase [Myceligenerans sp. TRM 65318]MBE1874325.1 alanine racemase [Myceligenerans sp. TRM 65318]MBE3016596.1 alanine racemase [Myceligenerans sp. TRM 65318]